MPRYRRRPAVFLWSRLLLALAVVFCLWLVWHLTDVLMPFAAAFALAYMAVPVVDRLGRMGVNRTLATNLMLLLAIALVVLVMLLVIPMFVSQIRGLVDRLPGLVDWLERTVSPRIHEFFGITVHFDVNSIKTGLAAHLGSVRSALANLLPALTSQGIALLTFLTNVLLTPLLAFYLLRDWHTLLASVERLLPPRWRAGVTSLCGQIDHMVGEYLRGQLAVMLIMAAFYGGGWLAVGLDSGFAIGVVAGLLVAIPYVGAFIGVLLATMAAILQYGTLPEMLMVWSVYAVGQTLEGFVITPRLVGDRIGLHPALVIFALMAAGSLFGFVGVLLALPASAVLIVLWREALARYYASRWYRRRIVRSSRPS